MVGVGGMHGRLGGVYGRGTCMAEGCGRGHAWHGGLHGSGVLGACMAGGTHAPCEQND